jgi:hypothetical protein
MQWVNRLMASVAAVLVTAGGASALPQESLPQEPLSQNAAGVADVAWAAAVSADSIEAYAEFLMSYPNSRYAPAAYDRLNQVALSSADAAALQGVIAWSEGQSDKSSPEILPGNIMII